MDDPFIGQKLDDYHILALLGRGGMARVYLGLDVPLQRYVSVKVIDSPYRNDPGYVQRFEREAQAVARLEHPNIVRMYRYGQARGLLYMVMQYIRGADLEDVLFSHEARGDFLPLPRVAAIIGELGLALDYAHDRGVIHCDVKPANVILNENDHPFLTDFGLALLAQMAESDEVFGTPQYMAPEQLTPPHQAVARSDLYALGVMLYQMVTGRLPFDDPDPMRVTWLQVNQAPPPPRRLRPGLDPALEQVILRSLTKDPAHRYPSGAALARALDRAASPAPPVLQPVTPTLAPRQRAASTPTLTSRATNTQRGERHRAARPLSVPPPPRQVPAPKPARSRRLPRMAIGCLALVLVFAILAGLAFAASGWFLPGDWVWPTPVAVESGLPTASSTEPPTPEPTRTPLPTETPPIEPTSTPLPIVTPTAQPTWTPLPTQAPAPVPALPVVVLQIVTGGDSSLFVVNRGRENLALPLLSLGNDKGQVNGAEWGIASLAPGACAGLLKAQGRSTSTRINCTLAAHPLSRDASDVFWKQEFTIYYRGKPVGTCPPDGCQVEIN
jgi:serine/threonine protein kinase